MISLASRSRFAATVTVGSGCVGVVVLSGFKLPPEVLRRGAVWRQATPPPVALPLRGGGPGHAISTAACVRLWYGCKRGGVRAQRVRTAIDRILLEIEFCNELGDDAVQCRPVRIGRLLRRLERLPAGRMPVVLRYGSAHAVLMS